MGIRPKKKAKKPRPANEVSEQEIDQFVNAIKDSMALGRYPKLRDLSKNLPIEPARLNSITRYLERSGRIIIDGDGYIIWSRQSQELEDDRPTFAEVAKIKGDLARISGFEQNESEELS
jgi:hypothetical protein